MSDRRPSRTRRPLGDLSNLPLPPSPPADGQQLFASKLLSYSIDCARGIPLEQWCTAGLLPTFGSSRTSCHRRFFNSSPAFLCCAVRLAHLFSTPPPKKSKGGSRPGSGRKPCPLRRLHTLTSHSVLRPSTRNGRLAYDSARRNELQLNQRLSELRTLSPAHQGVAWSHQLCVTILQVVVGLMLCCLVTKTSACRFVEHAMGHSYSRVMQLATAYLGSGVLPSTVRRPRGPIPYASEVFSGDQQRAILAQVSAWHAEGVAVTCRAVQEWMAREWDALLSVRRIRWYMRLWGCVWGRVYEMPPVDPIKHKKRVAQCIVSLDRARADEENGTHIIVYTDESYIHDNHAIQFSWFPSMGSNRIARAKRRGRLIIFHAITKDGLLTHARSEDDGNLNISTTNAEYVYHIVPQKTTQPTNKRSAALATVITPCEDSVSTLKDKKDDKEDYHGNIGTEMWMTWLENRLIPAFKSKYPHHKMILVMDNASYHNAHEDGWVTPSAMNKEQLVKAFDKYGIDSITVDREEVVGGVRVTHPHTFAKDAFRATKGGKSSPTVAELKKALSAYYKQHPGIIMTRTKRRFSEEPGWRIVWTPPLEPDCQPIEKLWGMVKNRVAWSYRVGRTVEETRLQLLNAFYVDEYPDRDGAVSGLRGVSADHCQGMIRKSREWMEKWITSEGVLRRDGDGRLWYREPTADVDTADSDDPFDQLARAAEVDEEWRLQGEDSECEEDEEEGGQVGLDALLTAMGSRVEEPEFLLPMRLHPLFAQITPQRHT